MIQTKLHTIYRLIDPRDNFVFYVGQTVNPKSRASDHNSTTKTAFKTNFRKAKITYEIKKAGLIPIFEIIYKNITNEEVDNLETGMISLHHLMGGYLTNISMGGRTKTGITYPTSSKTKEKLSKIKTKFKILTKEFLIEHYINQNKTFDQVAKENNCSLGLISRLCIKFKIKKEKPSSRRKSCLISKETLIELYINKNYNQKEVADKLKCSKILVYRMLKKFKIKKEKFFSGCVKGTKRTIESREKMSKVQTKYKFLTYDFLYEQYIALNKTAKQIAKEFGCKTTSAVLKRLKKHNIKKIK